MEGTSAKAGRPQWLEWSKQGVREMTGARTCRDSHLERGKEPLEGSEQRNGSLLSIRLKKYRAEARSHLGEYCRDDSGSGQSDTAEGVRSARILYMLSTWPPQDLLMDQR